MSRQRSSAAFAARLAGHEPGQRAGRLVQRLAAAAGRRRRPKADRPRKGKACILLWMSGGPSQTDTFDLKPGHANGGPFKEIETAVPGIQISEHLPGVAKQMKDLAIIRSLSTKEGEHGLATQLMLTGYQARQDGRAVSVPRLAAVEGAGPRRQRPAELTSASRRSRMGDAGFLGPNYSPLTVSGASDDPNARANLSLEDLAPPRDRNGDVVKNQFDILRFMQQEFAGQVRQRRRQGPPGQLRQGHADGRDAGPQGVRARRGEGRAARCLRPQPLRPGLPAGAAAGRARRGVRRGGARRHAGQRGRLGHARATTSTQVQRLSRGARPGLGDADGGPARARPARIDAGRLDGRVRPHAEDQPATPAATTSRPPGASCWAAAASRAAR